MAPEQAAGGRGEPRSDVYSLALVLLEALTGASPNGAEPLDVLATARLSSVTGDEEPLPPSLERLLRQALAQGNQSRRVAQLAPH